MQRYSALIPILKEYKVYSTLKQEMEQTPLAIENIQNISHYDSYIFSARATFLIMRSWFITRNLLHNLQQLKISAKTTFLFGQSIPASCQGFALKCQLNSTPKVTIDNREVIESRFINFTESKQLSLQNAVKEHLSAVKNTASTIQN